MPGFLRKIELYSSAKRKDIHKLKKEMKKLTELNKILISLVASERKESFLFNIFFKRKEVKFFLPFFLHDTIQKYIASEQRFYEYEILDFIEKNYSLKDKMICDIGANIGNHALYFSMLCNAKKVIAFEPQREIFDILKKNINLNKLNNNIEILPVALGNENGKASVINRNIDNTGMAQVIFDNDGDTDIATLDSLSLAPNFLKIDVEGFEIAVLQGAINTIQKYCPIIWIEILDEQQKNTVEQVLFSLGYALKHEFQGGNYIYEFFNKCS